MLAFNKSLLRRYFGRVIFPSNHYEIDMKWGKLVVKGQGNGHGVGLCQVGALGLAKRGWAYKQILAHYFPKHELRKIY